jgi:hypothetical protein
VIDQHSYRYLSHCEDTPFFMTTRLSTLEEATAATIQWVKDRLQSNGCGDGLVYDRHENEIVAIYGHTGTTHSPTGAPLYAVGVVATPEEATTAELKSLASAWDDAIETKDYPKSIWPTHSDFC